MNANVMKTNNGKRLIAAFIAIAMIVCAAAVLLPSDNVSDGATATAPADYKVPTGEKVVGTAADLMALAYNNEDDINDPSNGIIFVGSDGLTITLTDDISDAVNVGFVLAGNLIIQSENGQKHTLNIISDRTTALSGDVACSSVVSWSANGTFKLLNVEMTMDNNSTDSPTASLFNSNYGSKVENVTIDAANVEIVNSTITFKQTGTTQKVGSAIPTGSAWLQSVDGLSGFTVNNSTVTFDGTQAFMDMKVNATNSSIIMNDVVVGLIVANGSVIKDSTYTVTGSDNQGIDFKGNSAVTGTTISITDAGKSNSETMDRPDVMLYANANVAFTDSTLSAENIRVVESWNGLVSADGKTATINSGTINADFDAPITAVGKSTTGTYTLDGVTIKDSTAAKGASITVGDSGIVLDGTVSISSITNSNNAPIIISESADVTIPETTGVYDIANAKEPLPVKYFQTLQTAAGVPNAQIQIEDAIQLTDNIEFEDGVTLTTAESGAYIDLNGKSMTASNMDINAKVWNNVADHEAKYLLDMTGSFTLVGGSIEVTNAVINGDGNTIYVRSGQVVISGTLNGDLTIAKDTTGTTGNAEVTFRDFTVNAGSDLTILDSATFGKTIKYTTEGKFYLYGAILVPDNYDGAVIDFTIGSSSEFKAFPNATISPYINIKGTDDSSKIDLGEAMGTQYIRQDVTSNLNYSQTQTVIVEESIFIKKGATLTVNGQLIINENVELVIENGGKLVVNNPTAKVTVNGDITVEEGGAFQVSKADVVDISGSVSSDGNLTINSNVTVKNGGNIIVDNGTNSKLTIAGADAKLSIDAGGNVEIRGQADVDDIVNKGTVTLNGAVLVGDVKISMAADGAIVDIKSFSSDKTTPGKLEVTDKGLVFKDNKEPAADIAVGAGDYAGKANSLKIDATAQVGVKGLVITESVVSQTENKVTTYYNSFILSGTITIADETDDGYTDNNKDGTKTIQISGPSIDVTETLTIGKNVKLQLTGGDLDVSGTITATADGATVEATSGNINVSGMIETCVEIDNNINAFSYEDTVDGETVYYYTTLKTAIDNGQTEIEALGTTSVLESVDIPAGTQVKAGAEHDKITIGSSDARDVVVTVKDGGEFRSCIIDVMGTLTFDNKRDDRNNTITSDVYVEDDVSKSYTNIYTALNNAQSGETVTIYRSGSNVILDKDITVKEGVTLEIPSGKGVSVVDNVTVTVDGIIKNSGTLDNVKYDQKTEKYVVGSGFNPEADNNATIVVNGAFMSVKDIPFTDDVENGVQGYYIPGAYYNLVNTAGNWNYVTPVEDAAAVSNDVTGGDIKICGTNQVGDVTFTGDEDQPVIILVEGKLTASSLKLVYASIKVDNDDNNYQFDGTITSDAGSIEFINANGFYVDSTIDDENNTVMSLADAPAKADAEGADVKVTIASGNVSVLDSNANGNDLDVTGTEFVIAETATLTVDGANAKLNAKDLTVNGTLVAYDGGNVTAENVYVIGTFTVSPADSDNNVSAGSATVNGSIRVGISDDFETTSSAVLNADKIGNWRNLYVSAGSTVTEDLVKSKAYTQFFVNDELWFTVYANTSSDVNVKTPNVIPTENALLEDWTGTDVNGDTKTYNGNADFSIGTVERFDANVNYDIYKVTVFADPGVTAVYIDGKLMTSGYFKNPLGGADDVTMAAGFQAYVSAGEHEITYKLGNYFSGEATMTVNGDAVAGNTFTTSGMPDKDESGIYESSVDYIVYLQGINASAPETPSTGGSSDDGMGLTDYLLIVLIVLIVVMAILVAVRLMRS